MDARQCRSARVVAVGFDAVHPACEKASLSRVGGILFFASPHCVDSRARFDSVALRDQLVLHADAQKKGWSFGSRVGASSHQVPVPCDFGSAIAFIAESASGCRIRSRGYWSDIGVMHGYGLARVTGIFPIPA